MLSVYVNWGGAKVKLTWKQSSELPKRDQITSVHGFCFQDDKLLLVDLQHRGWDFPGGHIESNESPEACLKREVFEEGYVEGEVELLGYIIVDHSENPLWDENSPYPKIGYQIFYKMEINKVHPFQAKYESTRRMFTRPGEVESYYRKWNELYQEILDCAVRNMGAQEGLSELEK